MGLCIRLRPNAKAEWIARLLAFDDINPGLGCIEPKDAHRGVLPVGLHERNGTIECHWAVHLVFENITIVKSIGILIIARSTPNNGQIC